MKTYTIQLRKGENRVTMEEVYKSREDAEQELFAHGYAPSVEKDGYLYPPIKKGVIEAVITEHCTFRQAEEQLDAPMFDNFRFTSGQRVLPSKDEETIDVGGPGSGDLGGESADERASDVVTRERGLDAGLGSG